MKNLFNTLPALTFASVGTFLFAFICFSACSQSPSPTAVASTKTSVLTDSSTVLSVSLNEEYRLFKSKSGQAQTRLVVLRLSDMKEILVSSTPADAQTEPKFFWSQDSRNLITENATPDSSSKSEVMLIDLTKMTVAQRNPGALLAFDQINNEVLFYRSTPERQSICFYNLGNPGKESVRDIIAPPVGKLPMVIFDYKGRKARVKAFTSENTPVNVILPY